jgi:hypothetical protein
VGARLVRDCELTPEDCGLRTNCVHCVGPENIKGQKKRGRLEAGPAFFMRLKLYTQAITPLIMVQVFADCECVAVPLHEGGGPTTFAITTVTFCDGLKP